MIGTFALLYFGGYTLNTLTFGGLALGIGMIVDAAIVVLENTYRHLEMGKDGMTAAIDGAEEVWSAILASTLTHIAVFVPMLFLTGVSSIMFGQLAAVVSFSLAMSLFVAVTIVPVLCSRLLRLAPPAESRTRRARRDLPLERPRAERHRPRSMRARSTCRCTTGPRCSRSASRCSSPPSCCGQRVGFEFQPTTDEGEVTVDAELAVGTRIESTEVVLVRLEDAIRQSTPEATMLITQAGGGGGGGFGNTSTNRGNITVRLVPKDDRTRASDQIAMDLRRQLSGLPGVIVRTRASGGQQMMMRGMGGSGDGSRLSVEIRGHELDEAKTGGAGPEGPARHHRRASPTHGSGRDEGRPELAVRVDRDKAAMLGMTVTGVANTIRTNVAGTQAAMFREAGNEYPIVVRLREEDRDEISSVGDVLLSTPSGRVLPAKNVMVVDRDTGPTQIDRKNQERITRVNAEIEVTLSEAVANVQARLPELTVPEGLRSRLRQRSRGAGALLPRAAAGAGARHPAGLHRDGVAVRVAARPVHHHVLDSAGGHRRGRRAAAHEHAVQHAGLYRRHHAGRHRRQQRHPARGLRQHAAPARQAAAAPGRRAGRPPPPAARF